MTVERAKAEAKQLGELIRDLVTDYENESGLIVSEIKVNRLEYSTFDKKHSELGNVELTVEITD